jgi:hypothetical protein
MEIIWLKKTMTLVSLHPGDKGQYDVPYIVFKQPVALIYLLYTI